VSDWAVVFLGIIAVATLTTSILQIALLVSAGQLVRRIGRFVDLIEHEAKPILDHVNSISRDASRAASLATAQVERIDRLFTMLTTRVEETLETVQTAVLKPAREMSALMAGLRAALEILRDMRAPRTRGSADDEDTLFI
jgi:hypothetical protein